MEEKERNREGGMITMPFIFGTPFLLLLLFNSLDDYVL